MRQALLETNLDLPNRRSGKVRDLYDVTLENGEQALLIVATDRISAFDVVMANGLPGKGVVLTQISRFWFDHFAGEVDHHLISTDVVDALENEASPTARYFGRASQDCAAWWESIFGPTKPIWDASAVWRYLHPEDFTCEAARFEFKLGAPNLGSTETHYWVIPDPLSDGRIQACTSYIDQSAIDRMNNAVLTAIH